MHGEHLHPLGGDLHLARGESALDLLRRREIGEQAGQRRRTAARVPGDHVGEGVEVLPADSAVAAGPGLRLDADAQDPFHLRDEFRQRLAQPLPQGRQFLAERDDARVPELRIAVRWTGIGECVGDPRLLGLLARQGAVERLGQGGRVGDRAADAEPAPDGEFTGPSPERLQVGGAELPAGPGQHPHGRAASRRVRGQPQHGDHVRDLGGVQQAAETDDFDGQPAGAQCLGDRCGVGVAAHQHRRGGRRRLGLPGGRVLGGDPLRHPFPFGLDVGVQGEPDVTGDRLGLGAQHAHLDTLVPQRLRRRVRQLQGLGGVAPAGEQLEPRCGAAVRQRKVRREPGQIRRGRATPSVDRLHRVAHRGHGGHGVLGPAGRRTAEQRRQQDALGVAGVLVLVEQHHAEPGPLGTAHLRVVARHPGRERHLAAEVQRALAAQRLRQPLDQGQQFDPRLLHVENVQQGLRRAPTLLGARGQRVHEFVQLGVRDAQVVRLDEVLGELSRQRQHALGDRRGIAVGVEVAVPGADHAIRELPQFGLGQQRRRRFDGQQQPVLTEQSPGVRVIGAHLRLPGENAGP